MKTFRMNSLGYITEIKEQLPLNAYELADWLDEHAFLNDTDIAMQEISAMLRMQADEITALRSQLNEVSN